MVKERTDAGCIHQHKSITEDRTRVGNVDVTNLFHIAWILLLSNVVLQLVRVDLPTLIVVEDNADLSLRTMADECQHSSQRQNTRGKKILPEQRVQEGRFPSFKLTKNNQMKMVFPEPLELFINLRCKWSSLMVPDQRSELSQDEDHFGVIALFHRLFPDR